MIKILKSDLFVETLQKKATAQRSVLSFEQYTLEA